MGTITQNVDNLHQAAGHPHSHLLELHGSVHHVKCMTGCGWETTRDAWQSMLEAENGFFLPALADADAVSRTASSEAPDGDYDREMDEDVLAAFTVPSCPSCSGIVTPSFIFMGGFLQPHVKQRAADLVDAASSIVALGTSLQIGSAFQLVTRAHRQGKPLLVVNVGPTRADGLAEECVAARTGELMPLVAEMVLAEGR